MVKKKTKSYWEKRQEQWIKNQDKSDAAVAKKLESEYKRTAKELEKEIASYFQRYGQDDVIEFRTMMQDLPKKDKDLLFQNMEEFAEWYPEYAHLMPVRESIYQLNRMQGLHYYTQMKLLELGVIEQKELEKHLEATYGKHYKNMLQELGIGNQFLSVNDTIMRNTIFLKWVNDENFSDRIWANKKKLINYIENDFRDGLIRGDNYAKMVKKLADRMDVGSNDAKRLVWTESSFVLNQAHAQPYINSGIEEYALNAMLDSRTSEICKELDKRAKEGETFRFDEIMVGVNFPPFHAYCRTTFIGVLDNNVKDDTIQEETFLKFKTNQEAAEWETKVTPEWINRLTNEERNAIVRYTGSEYRRINEYLRNNSVGDEFMEDRINNISSGLKKFNLKENITTYRTFGKDALPVPFDELEGLEFRDKGFVSTSLFQDKAELFSSDYMMEVRVPAGYDGAYVKPISLLGEEHELLLDKGTSFKIINAVQTEKGIDIIAEVIPK